MADWKIEENKLSIDDLISQMQEFEKPGPIIDDTLLNYGGPQIESCIMPLLPSSGRTWRGKKAAASSVNPFKHVQEDSLSVIVRNKPAYGYLYFADDGSNTKRHQGGQHFMERGLETAAPDIIEKCLGALTEAMNN